MQQLENMMDSYQLRASEQKQQDHFVVRDLESLSASALYAKIKKEDYVKSNDRELNFYHLTTLKNFGETELGVQEEREKHPAFKERMKESGGYRIVPTIKSGS